MTTSEQMMDPVTCELAQLTRDEAAPQRVRDVMVIRPKTLPGNATLGQAREFFANPRVVNAVLVDERTFVGVLQRSDLPSLVPDTAPVRMYARRDVKTMRPAQPMQDALAIMDGDGSARLVVLEDDGVTLAGLLCLDLKRAGFCQG